MRGLVEVLAGIAILLNAVIYGTDVFGVDRRRWLDRRRGDDRARRRQWALGERCSPQRSRRLPWSSSWRSTAG
jgi:hypothetical protein